MSEGSLSFLEYNPAQFYISYTTYRNYDNPAEILIIIINDNLSKLDNLLQALKKYDESKLSVYHENDYHFVQHETQTVYSMNESYFFVGYLTRLIFDSDENIELVTYDCRHLLEDISFIIIQDSLPTDKMINACNFAKLQWENIKKKII